jgi:DNA (cytosine-5)-methyltransferase 1
LFYFHAAFADYFLMRPSEVYTSFMEAVQEKIYMSKIVIEFVTNNEDALYEDLLNKVQTTVPPPGLLIGSLTEDSLLRHAQWVIDQVRNVVPRCPSFSVIFQKTLNQMQCGPQAPKVDLPKV